MSLKTGLYIFCRYRFGLLFPVDLNVFKYTQIFHFQVRSQKSPRSVVAPPPSPFILWGCCRLLPPVLGASLRFLLLGFWFWGLFWMRGLYLGFMGFCSSAFPRLRTPGRAGDSVLQVCWTSTFWITFRSVFLGLSTIRSIWDLIILCCGGSLCVTGCLPASLCLLTGCQQLPSILRLWHFQILPDILMYSLGGRNALSWEPLVLNPARSPCDRGHMHTAISYLIKLYQRTENSQFYSTALKIHTWMDLKHLFLKHLFKTLIF